MARREIMQKSEKYQERTPVKAGVRAPNVSTYEVNSAPLTRKKCRAKKAAVKALDSRAYLAAVVAVVGVGNSAGGLEVRVQIVALVLLAIFAILVVFGAR